MGKTVPRRWWAVAIVLALSPVAALFVTAFFTSLPSELRTPEPQQSLRVEDRDGHLLRQVRTSNGALAQWVPLSEMSPTLPRLLVAVEDRRFYYHPGVDPIAVLRAAAGNTWRLRVFSGASTITMQLARNLQPHQRSAWGKWLEMALALRIELSLSKARILEEYLNRVDFGPNLRGIGAAARGYFGKPVAALSLGEMALLVGMPQGPSAYALHRYPARAAARRDRVLRVCTSAQIAPADAIANARTEPIQLQQQQPVFGAPHLIATLLGGQSGILKDGFAGTEARFTARIRTTLDPVLQRAAETALAVTIPTLATHHVTSGSALVLDNDTGEILAYVGSPDFFNNEIRGQVDGVRALRQPGSTLKPFVYAAALDELGYTPATVLPDLELHLATSTGDYAPRNFDDKFHGPVRLREALGNSLNIPAVHVAAQLGAGTVLRVLHAFGFDSLRQQPDYYGPAVALGDGEVTLLELVRAYASLARAGQTVPVHAVLEWEGLGLSPVTRKPALHRYQPPEVARAISPTTATLITDILADNRARSASFGLESALHFESAVAAKTGTSKGYRDNWVVGYSKRVTVGVWVGNSDGSPMREVSGITGAGPIFRAIMEAVLARYVDAEPLTLLRTAPSIAFMGVQDPEQAPGLGYLQRVEICPLSGQLRNASCPHGLQEYVPKDITLPTCTWHRKLPIDRRNGLLAGSSCPSSFVIEHEFEVLPDEYRNWLRTQGRTLPPDRYSPNCPEPESPLPSEEPISIAQPNDGSRYVIDPERAASLQVLMVTVVAPASSHGLLLEVDGTIVDRAARGSELRWRLQPGDHQLVALDESGHRSKSVRVQVRSAND
jgi:penicillin-binding protein 1C